MFKRIFSSFLIILALFNFTPSEAASPGVKYIFNGWRVPAFIPAGMRTNSPDLFFDFTKNLAWKKKGGVVSATSLLTVSRASTKYVNDSAGNWTLFSSNALAWSNLGALIEEARTNSIRNNSMTNAVVGTPGTFPTGWSIQSVPTGLTRSITALGTTGGVEWMEINWSGTAGSSSGIQVVPYVGATAATDAQTWAASLWFQVVQDDPAITQISNEVWMYDAANTGFLGTLQANATGVMYPGRLTWQRWGGVVTTNQATTGNVRQMIRTNTITNGTTVNFTIRIGWPQLELGASVTSPIRTTSAAVTRAADVVTLTSPGAFGSAYTSYVKATPGKGSAEATSSTMISFHDGTNNNQWLTRRDATTLTAQVRGFAGGSGFGPGAMAAWTQNVSGKVAGAYAVSDQAESFNGASVVASASAAVLVPNAVTLGNQASAATALLNGFLAEAGIWYSQRVPNAQLQSMTR